MQSSPLPCYLVLLRPIFSNTFSLCSSLDMSDQASHSQKTTGQITILWMLSFVFLDSKLEDKKFCTELQQAIPEFNLLYVLPSIRETKFHTHTKQLAKLQFCGCYLLYFWIANLKTKNSAPNYSKQSLNSTCSMFFPQYERPSFTLIQNNWQITVLWMLSFVFLDSKLEDKKFCTELQQAIPEFNLLLISDAFYQPADYQISRQIRTRRLLAFTRFPYLLTYLLHGAESFLRS